MGADKQPPRQIHSSASMGLVRSVVPPDSRPPCDGVLSLPGRTLLLLIGSVQPGRIPQVIFTQPRCIPEPGVIATPSYLALKHALPKAQKKIKDLTYTRGASGDTEAQSFGARWCWSHTADCKLQTTDRKPSRTFFFSAGIFVFVFHLILLSNSREPSHFGPPEQGSPPGGEREGGWERPPP